MPGHRRVEANELLKEPWQVVRLDPNPRIGHGDFEEIGVRVQGVGGWGLGCLNLTLAER